MSRPKMPAQQIINKPAPLPPPPPTEMAEQLQPKQTEKDLLKRKRRGASSLTIRRSVSTPYGGAGVNIT
jgi:hypothetical protein